jgi:hypothetical protein
VLNCGVFTKRLGVPRLVRFMPAVGQRRNNRRRRDDRLARMRPAGWREVRGQGSAATCAGRAAWRNIGLLAGETTPPAIGAAGSALIARRPTVASGRVTERSASWRPNQI